MRKDDTEDINFKNKLKDKKFSRYEKDMNPKSDFVQLVNFRINPLQHNFGDTKHRWVDYNLIATSRYGDYFDKVLTANPELNTNRESDWVEKVNILSSARPKAPEIDYVIPIF